MVSSPLLLAALAFQSKASHRSSTGIFAQKVGASEALIDLSCSNVRCPSHSIILWKPRAKGVPDSPQVSYLSLSSPRQSLCIPLPPIDSKTPQLTPQADALLVVLSNKVIHSRSGRTGCPMPPCFLLRWNPGFEGITPLLNWTLSVDAILRPPSPIPTLWRFFC